MCSSSGSSPCCFDGTELFAGGCKLGFQRLGGALLVGDAFVCRKELGHQQLRMLAGEVRLHLRRCKPLPASRQARQRARFVHGNTPPAVRGKRLPRKLFQASWAFNRILLALHIPVVPNAAWIYAHAAVEAACEKAVRSSRRQGAHARC